jgi:hypothetical protein
MGNQPYQISLSNQHEEELAIGGGKYEESLQKKKQRKRHPT